MKRWLAVIGLVAFSVGGVWLAWYARHRAVTPPAQSEPAPAQIVMHAPYLDRAASLAPDDPAWQQVAPVPVPLTYQVLVLPWGKSDKGPVAARAFHNGKTIHFRLEWSDDSENRGGPRVEDLPDAAALMFSLQAQQTTSLMMGFLGRVNIWHWKANWDQEVFAKAPELPANADFYPFENDPTFYPAQAAGNLRAVAARTTAVEDIASEGPGSITPKEKQIVTGRGVWREGRWQVVLERELGASAAFDARFQPGQKMQIAFAVWDGARGEKGSRKSISEWVELHLDAPAGQVASQETEPRQP